MLAPLRRAWRPRHRARGRPDGLAARLQVARQVAALVARLEAERAGGAALAAKDALVLRLNAQYPADVGVLSAYFLNLVTLAPTQARAPAAVAVSSNCTIELG